MQLRIPVRPISGCKCHVRERVMVAPSVSPPSRVVAFPGRVPGPGRRGRGGKYLPWPCEGNQMQEAPWQCHFKGSPKHSKRGDRRLNSITSSNEQRHTQGHTRISQEAHGVRETRAPPSLHCTRVTRCHTTWIFRPSG